MRLFELFEAKTNKKVVKSPPPRNFVAKNAHISGRTAGPHTKQGYNRKVKHSKKETDE